MLKKISLISMIVFATTLCLITNVRANESEKLESNAVAQQGKTLKGTVTDVSGPLIGASVSVKGTSVGTVTNPDGEFTLNNVSDGAVIVISYIGYVPQEISYTGQPEILVFLQEDATTLGEVVVTALGITRESKSVGYAVSTVKSNELVKTAAPNLGSALYGKAAGVQIQQAPGGAGTAVAISIRGLHSITGNNLPLIILDGVPIRNGNANELGYWDEQRINSNGLVDVNPEDIESISILKGAAATALYGSEANNGVMMITTKKASRGSGYQISVNAGLSADMVAYMPKFQTIFGPGSYTDNNGTDYRIQNDGFIEREWQGKTWKSVQNTTQYYGPKYDGSQVLYWDGKMRAYNPINSDPWSDLFRTAWNQNYNVSIAHGGENSSTRFSYTYIDNIPNQYNSHYGKNNFNLTGNMNFTKNLSLGYTANYMRETVKNRPYRISRVTNNFGGMFGAFDDIALFRNTFVTSRGYMNMTYSPTAQTLTPDEAYAYSPAFMSGLGNEYLWHVLGKENLETNNRLLASLIPSWKIIDGLTLKGKIATDFTANEIERNEHSERPQMYGASGYYSLRNWRYEIYYGDIMLSYDKNITEDIGLTANVGWQGRLEKMSYAQVNTNGGLSVENWFNLAASKNKADASMGRQMFLRDGLFATVGASYDNYLYLDATIRSERLSNIVSGLNKFTYPSVSGSFLYTEALKENLPSWYYFGKLRASYGITGNAPDVYKYNESYTQALASSYIYNITKENLGNKKIKPETKYEWEIGLENKFFKNRLGVELTYYSALVKDQIIPASLPFSAGGNSIYLNIGDLENKGFELSLYGTPVKTKDFSWDLNLNAAWNSNKVVKLMDGVPQLEHSNIDNGSLLLVSKVGEPMGDFYTYLPKQVEVNGQMRDVIAEDGLYQGDYDTRQKVGNAMPKWIGGLGTSFTYKNLALSIMTDFRIGGMVFNTPYQYLMGRGSLEESLKYRDAEHGGLTYTVDIKSSTGQTYTKTYDNGMFLNGVRNVGTPDNPQYVENNAENAAKYGFKPVASDYYYMANFNWGASEGTLYNQSLFENTYWKVREISLSYTLPQNLTQKFFCKNLTVSVFGRNLFYIYKNLPIFDAEATDATNWIGQTSIGGSTTSTRSVGVSLRANF
ncbi:MAG: SusC/RagA family TonB-linked outer membrane protein [Dysgonamonadaceae bacterium]|jgi:TonB-linked SusC/RagA family outer membrane protein|nr:SusC/RagA family TonB-linked outer membrane protein [Dysgonamonadaceae bacterium]